MFNVNVILTSHFGNGLGGWALRSHPDDIFILSFSLPHQTPADDNYKLLYMTVISLIRPHVSPLTYIRYLLYLNFYNTEILRLQPQRSS